MSCSPRHLCIQMKPTQMATVMTEQRTQKRRNRRMPLVVFTWNSARKSSYSVASSSSRGDPEVPPASSTSKSVSSLK